MTGDELARSEIDSLKIRVDRLENTVDLRMLRIENKLDDVLRHQAERAGGDRLFKFFVNIFTIIAASVAGSLVTMGFHK